MTSAFLKNLPGMTLGATVANLAGHHRRPFTAIDRIEWPFMILFMLASRHFPKFKEVILPVVIGSTIIFELIGPVMTQKAILMGGEVLRKLI